MKLKKFFAGVVAAAMMLTMGATAAFAAKGDTTPINDGKITIAKEYIITNKGTTNPTETFYLKQTAKSGTKMSTIYGGEAPDLEFIEVNGSKDDKYVASVTFNATKAENDNQKLTGNFEIGLKTYSGVGIFTYELQEVKTNNAGVEYDGRTLVVTVYATQGTSGIETQVTIHDKAGADAGVKVGTVTNTYNAGNLYIHKDVTGNMGDKNKVFKFTVTLTGESGKTYEGSYAISGGVDMSETEKSATSIAVDSSATIYLTDNTTVEIANLPYGVKYTVAEADYTGTGDTDGYTTKYGIDAAASTTGLTTTGDLSVSKASTTVNFENNKGGEIDTGVILDNAPYIALLAIVAFGGVALILNKRRRDEE